MITLYSTKPLAYIKALNTTVKHTVYDKYKKIIAHRNWNLNKHAGLVYEMTCKALYTQFGHDKTDNIYSTAMSYILHNRNSPGCYYAETEDNSYTDGHVQHITNIIGSKQLLHSSPN